MSHTAEINDILVRIDALPRQERMMLAYQILRDTRVKALPDAPRQTLNAAVGLLRDAGPAPSDEEVKTWMDEHRISKYGT
jgi:hypothetical protein